MLRVVTVDKKLSQKEISYLLKKYEARRKSADYSNKKVTKEDYLKQSLNTFLILMRMMQESF